MKNIAISLIFVWILMIGCVDIISAEDISAVPLRQINDLDTYIQNWEENYAKELEAAEIDPEETQYGYRPNPVEGLFPAPEISVINSLTALNLPDSYDLRDYGRVSSVKNQGAYGTCWAHSVMNSIESSLLTQSLVSGDIDLSERQLVYFTYNRGNDPLGNLSGDSVITEDLVYYNNGFNNIFTPFILSSWTGPVLESQAVYGQWSSLTSSLQYGSDAFHVKNIYLFNINTDRDNVKNAIQTYGAGVISYYSYSNYYQTGTYNNKNYTSYYYPTAITANNHSVSIIGWDDNFPKENFVNAPASNGAWLVKQSYGNSWKTQDGYFWLSYYDNSLDDSVYFYEAESADKHQRCYQYDGSASYYASYNDKMANIFTAATDETISAVSFGTIGSDYEYTVKVYTGCTASNPESGTLAATASGIIGNEFIKTVDLPVNVSVSNGQRFSVVVDLGGTANGPFLVDRTMDYSWVKFTSYGCPSQSFYYSSGKWYDMNSSCSSNAVIARIKAYSAGSPISGFTATVNGQTVILSWDSFSNASAYEVYQSTSANTGFTKIGTVSNTTFSINNLAYGSNLYFKVRALCNDGQYSDYSSTLQATISIPAVSGLQASVSGSNVQLAWDAFSNASSYEIYTANSAAATAWTKLGTSASPSYTIQGLTYGNTYYYKVRAILSDGSTSNYSAVVQVPISMPSVSGLTASVSGQTANLSWTALSGIKYYEIYSAGSASAASWKRVGISSGNAFTAKNLAYGSTLYYKVRALFTNGKYSNFSSAVPVSIVLPSVSGLSATVTDSTAVLTWSALTGAKSYEIYTGDSASTTSWKKLGTSTGITFTIRNLAFGSTSCYKVRALLTTGKYSNYSNIVTVSIRPNITGLKAVLSGQTAQLSWNALADAVSYEIYLAYPAKTLTWQKLGTSNSASYTAQDLLYGMTHYFRVRALFNDGTYSSYSAVVQVPVALPTVSGLTASVSGQAVQLSWSALSGAQSYEVALCTSQSVSSCKKTGTSNTTNFTVNNLVYGSTYFFSVRALLNSGKYSNYCSVVSAAIALPAVSGLTGSVNEQTVLLTWDKLNSVKYYEVYYAAASASSWRRIGTSGSDTLSIRNLAFGSTYSFKVRALFTNGKYSNFSNVFQASIAFPSISGLTAAVSKQTVQLSWNAITSATTYEVSRSTSESSGYTVLKTFKGTSYTDSGLAYGSTYYYRVRAKIKNGNYTAYSNPVRADIEEEKVTGVSASVSGQTSVHLSWNVKSTADSYEIYRAASANSAYEKIGTTTGTAYDDTDLTYGQTYFYKVRALCGSLYSEYSDPVSVVITLKVEGLSAAPCGNTVCTTLQWTALADAVSYDIYRSASETSGYTKVGSSAANAYSDSDVSLRQTYYYKVQAVLNGSVLSEVSDPASVTVVLKVTGLDCTTMLTWVSMPDAVLYEICRSSSANGSCEKTDTVTETIYTDSGVEFGKTYYYKVRAKLSDGEYSDYSDGIALTISGAATSGTISKEITETEMINVPADILKSVSGTASATEAVSFFWLNDAFLNDPNRPEMPATGFPTGHFTPLPDLAASSLSPTGITLRIPSLNLNAEVERLSLDEATMNYDVSALNDHLGYLEGTAIPGQGFSVLVGHNHLNTMEAGPFARLYEIEINDRLFITDVNDTLTEFSVYANVLADANDYRSIQDNVRENALLLITCEDETPEGSYLHRRIVFAEPLG